MARPRKQHTSPAPGGGRKRDLIEVGVRVHAEPDGWTPKPPGKLRTWPRPALLLHTVSCYKEGEPLRFGLWQIAHRDGPWMGNRRGVFHAEEMAETEIAELRALCASHGLPEPQPRKTFVDSVLYREAYKHELPLVGWFLPEDLSRLAAGWTPAGRRNPGDFSLIIWTKKQTKRRKPGEARRRPMQPNGEVEEGYRPRITIRMLDGQRPLISFRKPGASDEQDLIPEGGDGKIDPKYGKRGRFLSLSVLGSALLGEPIGSQQAACERFLGETPPRPHMPSSLSELFARALGEHEATLRLYWTLLEEHDKVAAGLLSPERAYSAASYGRAFLEAAGIEPPLVRNPSFPRPQLGMAMGAFFGGETAVRIRYGREPQPCAFLDYTSLYPVNAYLQGIDAILKAKTLRVEEEDPAEVTAWFGALTDDDLLDPAVHRQLALRFVEMASGGHLSPHRVAAGKHWKLQVGPLASTEPLPFSLQDTLRAALETGRVPRITAAWRVVADGRQPSLKPVRLPSGRIVAADEDLLFALAEERLSGGSWAGAKAAANATSSGLFAQMNEDERAAATLVHSWRWDGRQETEKGTAVEEPGRWYCPPIAASIPAGGRLLLYLARRLVERAGGTVAYVDTDSLAIIATEHDALIPSPGGRERDDHGRQCVRALSFATVDEIRRTLETLNPYAERHADPPPLLKIEKESLDAENGWRQAYLHPRSTKNYDRYLLHRHGHATEVEVLKPSEHALGHLVAHWDDSLEQADWVREGRTHLLRSDLGLKTREPDWFSEVALSIKRISSPDELEQLTGTSRTGRKRPGLRPFSRIAIAHPDPLYGSYEGSERVTPAAPWHDGLIPANATWRDYRRRRALTIRPHEGELRETDISVGGPVPVQTMRTVFARLADRYDRGLDHNDRPVGPRTSGPVRPSPTRAGLIVPIGRETNNLDDVGVTADPAYHVYTDLDRDEQTVYADVLRRLAPGTRKPGRPANADKPLRKQRAGELARNELAKIAPHLASPTDALSACLLYLETIGARRLVCDGCSRRLTNRQQRWCAECQPHRRRLARTS